MRPVVISRGSSPEGWPALGARLVVAAALALSASAATAQSDLAALRDEALALVNADRSERQLPALARTEVLDQAAQGHAEDMLERDYYAHVTPDGRTPRDRFIAAGGSEWKLVAENIARCSGCPDPMSEARVQAFEKAWMDSPEHRANILSPGLEGFGFGIATGGGKTYAVQNFAGPGAPEGARTGAAPDEIAPARRARRARETINDARAHAGAPPLKASDALDEVAGAVVARVGGEQATGNVDVFGLLPEGQAADWRALATVSGICGGCGRAATAQDVTDFVDRWLQDDGLRERLLDPSMSHLGFALEADGKGRKTAAVLLGRG
jgi:uncharacterized protein YkwD